MLTTLGWWWTVGPTLVAVAYGAFFTATLGVPQIRRALPALRFLLCDRSEADGEGDISHYSAGAISLAASIAPGSILGTVTALLIGGPGSLFWMWVGGVLLMAFTLATTVLGVRFRELDARGRRMGGPMLYLEHALRGRRYATSTAVGAALVAGIAALGFGVALPARFATESLQTMAGLPVWAGGLAIAFLTLMVHRRGLRTLAWVISRTLPLLVGAYALATLWAIGTNGTRVPEVLHEVIVSAFGGGAAGGGLLGLATFHTVRIGLTRGALSGIWATGLQAVPAAAARTREPVRQGLVQMAMCGVESVALPTLTALAVLVAAPPVGPTALHTLQHAVAGASTGTGATLVAINLIGFSLLGLMGWSYVGERCATFLLGERGTPAFMFLLFATILLVGFGAIDDWTPIALLFLTALVPAFLGASLLSGQAWRETRSFFGR